MLLPLEVPELFAFFDVPVDKFFLGAFFARGLGDVGGVDGGDSAEVGLRGGMCFVSEWITLLVLSIRRWKHLGIEKEWGW